MKKIRRKCQKKKKKKKKKKYFNNVRNPPTLWARIDSKVVSIKSIKPSLYPLPGPPIRPAWKTRGRTLLSLNNMNHPARTSKTAMLTKSSCFPTALLEALAQCFISFCESRQNNFSMFFNIFNYASGRASPERL